MDITNNAKHAAERENVERKIDRIVEFPEKNRGKKIPKSPNIEKYFKLEIYNEGKEDERLLAWRERTDVIDREINHTWEQGQYICIISLHVIKYD